MSNATSLLLFNVFEDAREAMSKPAIEVGRECANVIEEEPRHINGRHAINNYSVWVGRGGRDRKWKCKSVNSDTT
jgi:hypothetical protein